jgi:hypothetical protein
VIILGDKGSEDGTKDDRRVYKGVDERWDG